MDLAKRIHEDGSIEHLDSSKVAMGMLLLTLE
jgi:hypothetical protein